ncbi:hypothetical protein HMPREF1016_01094 [Bacteroides eggerthii 1_2_48FAA]|uniref:Uncharacterized protein n=1 Tax=Bacteroides eggerthii 1_2_48FAA TaxID=665953 RepID=E5WWP2_9BACE|nr:hypothetical protein HMPREF1016_01094 [Bacteroides eggerthii 1_2_48FAA]
MPLCTLINSVFQLRIGRLPIAGCAARRWKPYSPQLENKAFVEVQLHLSGIFSI